MKILSRANLQRLISDIQGDMSGFSSSAICTFEEVYENLEALDQRITGLSYSQADETIIVPAALGNYVGETETIVFS